MTASSPASPPADLASPDLVPPDSAGVSAPELLVLDGPTCQVLPCSPASCGCAGCPGGVRVDDGVSSVCTCSGPVLFFTTGLPASGKSSFAALMVEAGRGVGPGVVAVCKDELRLLPDAPLGRGRRERFVVARQDEVVASALGRGVSVVAHDTNFNPRHRARFACAAARFGARLVEVDFSGVDVRECVARDVGRPGMVGAGVIWSMWQQYLYTPPGSTPSSTVLPGEGLPGEGLPGEGLPEVVLVDVDGTLARMNGRGPFEWDRVGEDVPVGHVVELVRLLASSCQVVFLSGRDGVCREATQAWLDRHVGVPGELLMRPPGDVRPDWVVKSELFELHILGRFKVRFALDDRDQVVFMWRDRGIPVLQVEYGFF